MLTKVIHFFKRQPWMLAFLALICLWEAASYGHLVGSTLLASPGEVWHVLSQFAFPQGALRQSVYMNALYTFRRALTGWCIALFAGSALGLVVGSIEALSIGTEPIMEFARVIPPVLALPLFLVAFNYSEPAYTWTIVFGCLPVMSLSVARGVQSISREKMELLSAYRVARPVRAFAVVMEILPSVFLGARLTLTMALIVTVVTEMVFTPSNGWALGALARDSEISFDTPRFYGCIVIVALFGYLANVGIRKLEERLGVGGAAGHTVTMD